MKPSIFYPRLWILFLLTLVVGLGGCSTNDPVKPDEIPLGEIRAKLQGEPYYFNNTGNVLPSIANSYNTSIKYTSIYRETSFGVYGTMQIVLLNIDLDTQTYPLTVKENARVTFYPEPNASYSAQNGAVTLVINSFDGDVLTGTMSGRMESSAVPGRTISLEEGAFRIQLDRQ